MMTLNQARLVFHGAIVLLLSLLCGLPLFLAVQQGWGDEAVRFWRSTHVGLAAVGVWSIATGAVLGVLVLEGPRAAILAWSVILSNYAIALSLLLRAAAQAMQLDPAAAPLRQLVASTRNLSAITGFVAVFVMVRGAALAVRAAKGRPSVSSGPALQRSAE